MTNKYIIELNQLINFGISEDEELTREARYERMKSFRADLSYEKYQTLFKELQDYILNEEILINEKEQVILLMIEFIRNYPILEDNINKFPKVIVAIYNSHMNLNRLMILFEQIYYSDVCIPSEYERIVNEYFNYLDSLDNELYIHYCYSRIALFNNKLIEYLNKTDYNGVKHKDNINNPELISLLKSKINNLNNQR